MHPIDEAILSGALTPEMLEEHAARELPPLGASYWGDCMHVSGDPELSALSAARQMGAAVDSLGRVR